MLFFGWWDRQLFCGLCYKPKINCSETKCEMVSKKEAIVQSTDGNIAVDTIDTREAARRVRALPDTVTNQESILKTWWIKQNTS